jgi:hypothetical protein
MGCFLVRREVVVVGSRINRKMRVMQTKHLIQFLCATAMTAALVAAFNFVVDPLQIFHPALFYPAQYSSNPRIGDAGLIRSQNFDTVFMGTSLGFHFRQSEIDQSLGGKSLKLAISGGTSKEERLIISAALQRHPKRIIWQMDDWMFRDSADVDKYLAADLYLMNPKGVADYLFGLKTSREAIWILLRRWKSMQSIAEVFFASGYITFNEANASEINTFPSDFDLSSIFNAARAREAFELSLKSPSEVSAGFDYDSMVHNFDRDATGVIDDNPDTPFVIYFPPYSILHWVAMREIAPQVLQMVYRFNEYQLKQLSLRPNVTVYDFRDIEEITYNLDNYRDTIHHSTTINQKILTLISSGAHAVDRSNPTAAVEKLKGQVERYKLRSQTRADDDRAKPRSADNSR